MSYCVHRIQVVRAVRGPECARERWSDSLAWALKQIKSRTSEADVVVMLENWVTYLGNSVPCRTRETT